MLVGVMEVRWLGGKRVGLEGIKERGRGGM